MTVSSIVQPTGQSVNLNPTPEIKLPVSSWMTDLTASRIDAGSVPWLLAQGWKVENIEYDKSTTPPTPYYNLSKQGMIQWAVLQSLVNTYTNAYNEGRAMNADRYNNIVTNWGLQVGQCMTTLNNMVASNNASTTIYVTSLNSLLTGLDASIDVAITEAATIPGMATALGVSELARINEQFDNLLAKTRQELTNRGFYSSTLIAAGDARVERERALAIADLNDKINRQKMDATKFLVETRQRAIGQKLEANMARIRSLQDANAKEMELYKYMVDTTNGIVLGLFNFQERRTDAYPNLEIMAQICAQLGDSGATSWVSP